MLIPDWVDALGGGELADLGFAAQHGQVADVAAVQDLRGPQDPHVLALGQHDMATLGAGPFDQVVQEPQRRHPLRPGQVQPLEQFGLVHLLGPEAQRGGHLAAVPGPDLAADLRDTLGGHVGVVRGGENRERRLRQQRVDGGVRGQPAGKDERGRDRELGRERRRQAGDQHVGAVARDDHQGAVVEHVQEVRHVHGRHLHRVYVALEVRQAGHLAEAQGGGHLAGGGPGDVLELREDVDRAAGRAGPDRGGDPLQVLRLGAVDHDRQQRAALGNKLLAGHLDGVGGLRHGATLGAHDGDDGCREVVGEPGVEVEFDGGILAGEVRALDDDHVAVPAHLGEDLDAAGVDLPALALGEEAADLLEGQPAPAPGVV